MTGINNVWSDAISWIRRFLIFSEDIYAEEAGITNCTLLTLVKKGSCKLCKLITNEIIKKRMLKIFWYSRFVSSASKLLMKAFRNISWRDFGILWYKNYCITLFSVDNVLVKYMDNWWKTYKRDSKTLYLSRSTIQMQKKNNWTLYTIPRSLCLELLYWIFSNHTGLKVIWTKMESFHDSVMHQCLLTFFRRWPKLISKGFIR